MPFTPTAGRYAIASKKGTPDVPFAAMNWKLDLDGKPANASNFRDGRKGKITLPDGTLTMDLVWDQADQPTKAAGENIRLGTEFEAKCFVDGDAATPAAKFFLVPVFVAKLSPASAVEGELVKMPVVCNLNGDITYPADS